MKLTFEIPASRIQEIINCVHEESELDKRINSFEMWKQDRRAGACDLFTIELDTDNSFFIQRMAEVAREKSEEERNLAKYYSRCGMSDSIASCRTSVSVGSLETKHYDENEFEDIGKED